jgi:predicted nucleic acid binding AN1-type Zn finger protein
MLAWNSLTYHRALQATVQDREVQCAEGDPCRVQEWCSEEGIHCRLRFRKPQIIRFWCPILYCYSICTRIFDWKYREKLKSKSAEFSNIVKTKKSSVILCCECFVSVTRSFLLLVVACDYAGFPFCLVPLRWREWSMPDSLKSVPV